jgi:N-methylhydantoinase B/oxoprolinase/acetone carboxylase alpha subunit
MNEPITDWTEEESLLVDAARHYYAAIAMVMETGGRANEAMFAAMPAEMRSQVAAASGGDMMQALADV